MSGASSTERDWDYLIQPGRVHRTLYTDPTLFQDEMRKVFGGVWTYLCHDSEIPEPNDFRLTRLGQRPVIVTRGSDGQIHALFNRCSHRAATVCQEQKGRASRFMCRYHGWTYGNDGRLLAISFDEGYGGQISKRNLGLPRVSRVESYRGFIFGTLNPAMPSLTDYLGKTAPILDTFIDRAPGGKLVVQSGVYRGAYRGNWKLAWDNAADGYHPLFSHRSLVEMTAKRYGREMGNTYLTQNPDNTEMYVQVFEHGHTFLHVRPAMGSSLWARVRPTPGSENLAGAVEEAYGKDSADLLEKAPGAGMNLNIFPNLMIIGNQIQVVEPMAADRTQLSWYATTLEGAPEEVNQLRMRIAEDFPNFGEADDLEIFERCHDGLMVPEAEWVRSDRGLHRDPAEHLDEAGVLRLPATDEAPMRRYMQAYKSMMEQEPQLVLG